MSAMIGIFFRSNEPNKPPPWQEKSIITGWETDRAACNAFKRMLDSMDLWWSKVTHIRTVAIEYASTKGLSRAEIATMSKHAISSLDDFYITQLFPPALLVMSGFEREEVYNVRRTLVKLPI
jgi:hypothetical protein